MTTADIDSVLLRLLDRWGSPGRNRHRLQALPSNGWPVANNYAPVAEEFRQRGLLASSANDGVDLSAI